MGLWWMAMACVALARPAGAEVAYHELRLSPPAGWTAEMGDGELLLTATAETGAMVHVRGPHATGDDFPGWFRGLVKAQQADAVNAGEATSFRTANGLSAMRQTWRYVWGVLFIVGDMDRSDLAILRDGRAWHLYVETGRTPEVHQAALAAVTAMLDTVRFGPDEPPRPNCIGDVTFAMPEGWRRLERDGGALLRPADLPDDAVAELWIPPSSEIEGSLESWLRATAEQTQAGETVVEPLPTGAEEGDPVAGPVDLAWSTTTATGEPRVRYYHAERRDGKVIAFSLVTSGMELWDRYGQVIRPFQRSLRLGAEGDE